MKHTTTTTLLFFLTLLIILSNTFYVEGGGIGVSSTPINIPDALRGTTYYRTLTIHNLDKFKNTTVLLNATGIIEEWITFHDYTNRSITLHNLTIPADSKRKVTVNITVPENVSNGNYTGTITVSELNEVVNVSQAAVVTVKYPIPVIATVTGDQNLNATIDTVYINDNEVNYPIEIFIHIRNTGNVVAEPEIQVDITKNNVPVETITDTEEKIHPGSLKVITLRWNSTGMVPGEYLANVTIILGGNTLLSKDIPFRLLSPGTLSRNGVLTNVVATGNTTVGEKINIIATFENTGDIEVTAWFIGNVYKDNQLIDTIESLEKEVPKHTSYTFYTEYTIPDNGSYVIEGFVRYGDAYGYQETNVTRIVFKVGSSSPSFPLLSLGITAIGICSILLVFYSIHRKKLTSFPLKVKRQHSLKYLSRCTKLEGTRKHQVLLSSSSPNIEEIERMLDNLPASKTLTQTRSKDTRKKPMTEKLKPLEEKKKKREKRIDSRKQKKQKRKQQREQRKIERKKKREQRLRTRESRKQQRKKHHEQRKKERQKRREQRIRAREVRKQERKEHPAE